MVYSYKPTYYTSFQDSVTSLCKNILPFSFKKKRLPAIAAAEQRLSKQQTDNLKWQQESFHQILKLMGLCKEDLVTEAEVSDFRTHLLDTLIASPLDHEHSEILKDKLVFLQELFYAKCISEAEYHASKRPLLQRLAVQGAEIEAKDVIIGAQKKSSDEEWSIIDLKDEKHLLSKEAPNIKNKLRQYEKSTTMKGVASVFGIGSSQKNEKFKEQNKYLGAQGHENSVPIRNQVGVSTENPFWDISLRDEQSETKSILMQETLPIESKKMENQSGGDKVKRKPFKTLFHRVQKEGQGKGAEVDGFDTEENIKSGKKQWGFDKLKKWNKNDSDDEEAPLASNEKSQSHYEDRQENKQIKSKMMGENIKKELSQIQAELRTRSTNIHLQDRQVEGISTTRLPANKADLENIFPKSWCNQHGDRVLEVVRKEYKGHVGEMAPAATTTNGNSKRWTTFDVDEENYKYNPFSNV